MNNVNPRGKRARIGFLEDVCDLQEKELIEIEKIVLPDDLDKLTSLNMPSEVYNELIDKMCESFIKNYNNDDYEDILKLMSKMTGGLYGINKE